MLSKPYSPSKASLREGVVFGSERTSVLRGKSYENRIPDDRKAPREKEGVTRRPLDLPSMRTTDLCPVSSIGRDIPDVDNPFSNIITQQLVGKYGFKLPRPGPWTFGENIVYCPDKCTTNPAIFVPACLIGHITIDMCGYSLTQINKCVKGIVGIVFEEGLVDVCVKNARVSGFSRTGIMMGTEPVITQAELEKRRKMGQDATKKLNKINQKVKKTDRKYIKKILKLKHLEKFCNSNFKVGDPSPVTSHIHLTDVWAYDNGDVDTISDLSGMGGVSLLNVEDVTISRCNFDGNVCNGCWTNSVTKCTVTDTSSGDTIAGRCDFGDLGGVGVQCTGIYFFNIISDLKIRKCAFNQIASSTFAVGLQIYGGLTNIDVQDCDMNDVSCVVNTQEEAQSLIDISNSGSFGETANIAIIGAFYGSGLKLSNCQVNTPSFTINLPISSDNPNDGIVTFVWNVVIVMDDIVCDNIQADTGSITYNYDILLGYVVAVLSAFEIDGKQTNYNQISIHSPIITVNGVLGTGYQSVTLVNQSILTGDTPTATTMSFCTVTNQQVVNNGTGGITAYNSSFEHGFAQKCYLYRCAAHGNSTTNTVQPSITLTEGFDTYESGHLMYDECVSIGHTQTAANNDGRFSVTAGFGAHASSPDPTTGPVIFRKCITMRNVDNGTGICAGYSTREANTPGTPSIGYIFEDCISDDNSGYGFDIFDLQNSKITGCKADNNKIGFYSTETSSGNTKNNLFDKNIAGTNTQYGFRDETTGNNNCYIGNKGIKNGSNPAVDNFSSLGNVILPTNPSGPGTSIVQWTPPGAPSVNDNNIKPVTKFTNISVN